MSNRPESDACPQRDHPVDPSVLAPLESIHNRAGESVAEVLIRSFVQEAPELLEGVKLAARSSDWTRVMMLACALRSTSELIGARRVTQRSVDLERAARTGWQDRIRRLIALLEAEQARVMRWLTTRASESAASVPPIESERPSARTPRP